MLEQQIVSGCLRGDVEAQRELYDRYANRLLFVCRRYAGDSVQAEDLLHDAYIKIFGVLDKFKWKGEGSLRAWMERVTINVALEYLRKSKNISFTSIDSGPVVGAIAEPTAEQVERMPQDVLSQFIDELPDGYRTVFNLYCVEEYSHKEIAQMLGINEKSSSSQLFRAKALLASRIKNYLTSRGD